MLRGAVLAKESSFLDHGFLAIERRIIRIVGDVVYELGSAVLVHAFRVLLRSAILVITPDLSTSIGLFPHVVESDDPGLFY